MHWWFRNGYAMDKGACRPKMLTKKSPPHNPSMLFGHKGKWETGCPGVHLSNNGYLIRPSFET